MKTVGYCIVVVGFVLLFGTAVLAEDAELGSLRKTLFAEDSSLDGTFRVKEENARLQAIRKLEADGSARAVGILTEFLTTHEMERKLKQHSLMALGRIGTKEAIDGILKFESWSRKSYIKPQPFHFGKTDGAIDHFARYHLIAVATAEGEGNEKWAIFPWSRYGKQGMWLTRSKKEGSWSDPILLDLPGMPHMARMSDTRFDKKCDLKVDGEVIMITCDGKTLQTSVGKSLKDSDGDGLTDAVEARFLTDPSKLDSDKDGVVDGKDCNPLTPLHSERSDEAEIRQAVFSVLFATCSSRDAIVIVENGPYANQEYYGYGGAVLRSAESRNEFVNVTGLTVNLESDTTASVRISDWEGNEAASMHEGKLKKVHGKWIVVEFALTMIS